MALTFMLLLVIIAGTRFEGYDYYEYIGIYERTNFSLFSFPFFDAVGGTTGNEFFYASISSLFKIIGLDYTGWFVFIATVSIYIKYFLYRKLSPYIWVSILLFICFLYIKELGQIRNALASSLVMVATYYAVQKKLYRFLAFIFIAFGVQSFSLIGLPIYFIINNRINKTLVLMFFVLLVCVGLMLDGLGSKVVMYGVGIPEDIYSKLQGYYNSGKAYGLGPLGYFYLLISFLALFFRKRIVSDPNLYGYYLVALYGISNYFLFRDIATLGSRASDMFTLSALPIVLPILAFSFAPKYRVLINSGTLIIGSLYFFSIVKKYPAYQSVLFLN